MTGELPYSIRPARPDDLDAIMALLGSLTRWLADRGSDQWQGPDGRRRNQVRSDIEYGSVWVVQDGRDVIGTITVDEFADTDFWHDDDHVHTALYAHRMGVARSHKGQMIGAALLDWASALVEKRELSLLRFDAWATNDRLHWYYENLDFAMVRNRRVIGRGSGALFERDASARCGGPQFAQPVPDPPAIVDRTAPDLPAQAPT